MAYFRSFPETTYKFGNEKFLTAIQDISAYVDLVDQLKDQVTSYEFYNIQPGDRPDNVSFSLYGTEAYYWTFYFMNDHLRRSGWPLSQVELNDKLVKKYPNRTLTFKTIFSSNFKVGENVYGVTSTAGGVIVKRNLELGQLVVKPTNNKSFTVSELIQSNTGLDGNPDGSGKTVEQQVLDGSNTPEYLSAHHYEDASGNHVDIDPTVGPGSSLVEVTYRQEYTRKNDSLKRIKFIKPNIVTEVVRKFEQELK